MNYWACVEITRWISAPEDQSFWSGLKRVFLSADAEFIRDYAVRDSIAALKYQKCLAVFFFFEALVPCSVAASTFPLTTLGVIYTVSV